MRDKEPFILPQEQPGERRLPEFLPRGLRLHGTLFQNCKIRFWQSLSSYQSGALWDGTGGGPFSLTPDDLRVARRWDRAIKPISRGQPDRWDYFLTLSEQQLLHSLTASLAKESGELVPAETERSLERREAQFFLRNIPRVERYVDDHDLPFEGKVVFDRSWQQDIESTRKLKYAPPELLGVWSVFTIVEWQERHRKYIWGMDWTDHYGLKDVDALKRKRDARKAQAGRQFLW